MNVPAGLGLLVRPVPLPLLQAIATLSLKRVLSRHPQLFDRLGEYGKKRFGFIATDLDLAFIVTPAERSVTVHRARQKPRADIRIKGTMPTLLALAEGRLDGDAEFFSRGLSIAGDTEAILALRNAMDDCRIDLTTDLAPPGPLGRPVGAGLRMLRQMVLSQGGRQWN